MIHFPAVNDEFGKNVGRDEMNLAEFPIALLVIGLLLTSKRFSTKLPTVC